MQYNTGNYVTMLIGNVNSVFRQMVSSCINSTNIQYVIIVTKGKSFFFLSVFRLFLRKAFF